MKVAIAWYGAEGQSSYRYYVDKGHDVTIVTTKVAPQYPIPKGAKSIVQDDAFSLLDGFDIVVRSSGLRPDSLMTDGHIWSATNEFFAVCPAPIIGVTGTKGKGTTASLIASILKAAGKTVHLVGNIGTPALEVVPNITADDIVVYELSSFQLWDLEKSPHVAVVLMIEPDHLDVHHDMDEYVAAKAQIAAHQQVEDIVFYHPTNQLSKQVASVGSGRKVRYGVAEDGFVYVNENTFFIHNNPLMSTKTLQLAGEHNIENACAAISAAWLYTQDIPAIERGLKEFKGLPHRLQFVRDVKGVRYYDDSIATTPGSAIAALRSFSAPKVIILGGSDKGADYGEIIELCKQTDTKIVAIGQTGEKIHAQAIEQGIESYRVNDGMGEVVVQASQITEPGSVVILSPASASFDQYTSYADRGDQFVEAVSKLA